MRTRKKIGIVTLNGYFNYGNRLQNYALQEVIKELGFDVETFVVKKAKRKEAKKHKIARILKLPLEDICKRILRKALGKLSNILNRSAIRERTNVFKDFSKKHLNERFYGNSEVDLKNSSKNYDYLVTGSDQVWNPHYIKTLEYVYFMTFAEPEKRISYAASFGLSELPDHYEEMVRPWLAEMKSISVREKSGVKIVKDLTGRDAVVSLDPTLLLSKERWLSIAKEGPKPNRKFVLTYFLGKKPEKGERLIEDIVKEYKYEVVNLADMKDKQVYCTGPQEFIDYFNCAEVIFTDSFHGCVFSILMEKPFVVFERIGSHDMYSRIETLLNLLDLKDREASNIKDKEDVFAVNFTHVNSLLQGERTKAFSYLGRVIN